MTHPLYRNLARAHGFEDLQVDGELPEDLIGTLYRAGPGLFERFGARVSHPFEADGAITAVRLDGQGGASGAVRIVESRGYVEEQAAGRSLYGSTAGRLQQLRNNFAQRSKNTGNTSAWAWQQRVFGLMEGARPTELDPDTLAVLDERDFDGVLGPTFSAHPHRVASLATTFNFGVRYGKQTRLDLYELPDVGAARRLGEVELPWATMVHDFAATEHHLVFAVCPARLVLWRALLGIGGFAKLFEWTPSLGSELIVVPLAAPDRPQRISCEPFWVWHFANAFARSADELCVDLCRYDDFSSLDAIGSDGQPTAHRVAPPVYHRVHVEPARGRMRSEILVEGASEFPRVHREVEGAEHHVAWIRRGIPEGSPREGIARVELDGAELKLWRPDANVRVSEPVPVARPGRSDEREVWVLVLCHDDLRERSFVAVLDGRDPEAGPVAQLWFGQSIPLSFHGNWRAMV